MPRLAHIAIITWAMSWQTPWRSCHAAAEVVRTEVAPWAYSNDDLMRSEIASAVARSGAGSLDDVLNGGETWTVE